MLDSAASPSVRSALQAHLIVDHRRRRVEWYVPGVEGLRLHAAITRDGEIDVPCPGTVVTLDAIYAGVTRPAVSERASAGYRARVPDGALGSSAR